MEKIISRKQATRQIRETLKLFCNKTFCITQDEMQTKINAPEFEACQKYALKIYENIHKSDYALTLSSLDAESFAIYYETIGRLAELYKVQNHSQYDANKVISIENLDSALQETNSTERKLEFIESFTGADLADSRFSYKAKERLILDILADKTVFNRKENAINQVINSFNDEERQKFMTLLCGNSNELLDRIISKVNGKEQRELLVLLSNLNESKETNYIVPGFTDLSAEYKKQTVHLTVHGEYENEQKGRKKRSKTEVILNPFANVQIPTENEEYIEVPALYLISKENIESLLKNKDLYASNFEGMTAERQLQSIYKRMENVGTDFSSENSERAALSKELRSLANLMKLDDLFNLDNDFMNEELRDFLNLNDNGSDVYKINDVIRSINWFEFMSSKAACHQQQHLMYKEKINLYNAKFGNNDGREVVFNANYETVSDYPDKGTFNYKVPKGIIISPSSLAHKRYDVDPFYPMVKKKGFESNLIADSFNKYSPDGYNSEYWDKIREEEQLYDDLLSKEEEFEELKKIDFYQELKTNYFKGYKSYPQSYIDYFIKESKK